MNIQENSLVFSFYEIIAVPHGFTCVISETVGMWE